MSLNKPQAVPVDVHMWQIAQRDYGWYPTTTQAKGPSPQANKELGKWGDARADSRLRQWKLLTLLPKTPPLRVGVGRANLFYLITFYLGNFFRSLWGPYAGWAQAVSIPTLSLLLSPDPTELLPQL